MEKTSNSQTLSQIGQQEEVHYLAQKGIINGYENGAFGASDPITRLHSALLLDRAIIFSDDISPNPAYADINEGNYGYEVVARLTAEGIFSGSNQHFYPDHSLTRTEMAKIIVEAFDLVGTPHSLFQIRKTTGVQTTSVYLPEITLQMVTLMEPSTR